MSELQRQAVRIGCVRARGLDEREIHSRLVIENGRYVLGRWRRVRIQIDLNGEPIDILERIS